MSQPGMTNLKRGIQRIPGFFRQFLEVNGCLCEPQGDTLETVLAPEMARNLGLSETVGFAFDPAVAGVFVGMGSDVLEKALEHTAKTIPVAFSRLEGLSLRGKNLAQDLSRDLTFLRCTPGALDNTATMTPLTQVFSRITMRSDEIREMLVSFLYLEESARLLPAETQIPADGEMIALPADDPRISQLLPLADVLAAVQTAGSSVTGPTVTAWQKSHGHRLQLDIARLAGYHGNLLEGLEARKLRHALPDAELESKRQAIKANFLTQLEDLRRKYAIEIHDRPIAVRRLLLPVLRVITVVKIGTLRRELSLLWSPLHRAFEPFLCPACRRHGRVIEGTRDGKLLCRACAA
jgi:hypothetical protein